MATDVERLTRVYLKIRDAKKAIAREYKEKLDKLDGDLETIGNALLSFLNETNQKSARTGSGTFYKQKEILPTASDWQVFYNWIKEEDAFDFLERRIKKTAVAKYMEEHKDGGGQPKIPPGVSVLEGWSIRVRKPNEEDDAGE